MWTISGDRMSPLLPFHLDGQPWHSHQYQALPQVYAQTASLEIAKTAAVIDGGSISGVSIKPFVVDQYEGFDINTQEDFDRAEWLVDSGRVILPNLPSTT
jgi:N-acylneuraminate cytidylyltransferase